MRRFFAFADGAVTCSRHSDDGALSDLVRLYAKSPAGMDETLVLYYTIELLRTLHGLHSAGVVHGNVHPSTVLLRNDAEDEDDWQKQWTAEGQGGWADRGILLSGLQHAFVAADIPEGVTPVGSSVAEVAKQQQRTGLTFGLDYLGLAYTVHYLLFGQRLKVAMTEQGWMPSTPFK